MSIAGVICVWSYDFLFTSHFPKDSNKSSALSEGQYRDAVGEFATSHSNDLTSKSKRNKNNFLHKKYLTNKTCFICPSFP